MIEGHEQDVKWLAEWLSDPANAEPSWMLQSNDRRASQRGVLAWHGDHIALELVRNALGPVGAGPLYVGRTNAALQLRLGPTRLGRVKASSLRGSLAALLWDELELRCAVPYTLDEVATTRLSNWMSQHLSVTIVPIGARSAISAIEAEVLRHLDPPLNLNKVGWSPARTRLRRLRNRHLSLGGDQADMLDQLIALHAAEKIDPGVVVPISRATGRGSRRSRRRCSKAQGSASENGSA